MGHKKKASKKVAFVSSGNPRSGGIHRSKKARADVAASANIPALRAALDGALEAIQVLERRVLELENLNYRGDPAGTL